MSIDASRRAAEPGRLAHFALPGAAVPMAGIGLIILLQAAFLLEKPFNWDEYLHFSKVYLLRSGTLDTPFQTLLARLIAWSADVPGDLIDRMMAARAMLWLAFATGLGAIYALARRFGEREDALWAVLAYLAGGYVFAHGFAIRTDPIAMAMLMTALALLASMSLTFRNAVVIGVIVGAAGVLTVKSVFYAPCFLGLAWLRFTQAGRTRACAYRLSAVVPVAAIVYGLVLLAHRSGLAAGNPARSSLGGFAENGLQWLTQGILPQTGHTVWAFLLAPVYIVALAPVLRRGRGSGGSGAQRAALIGLCLPLASLLFYRNAFPYFFVFILAPVAAALPPALAEIRKRYGRPFLAALLMVPAIMIFVTTPREELGRQRAVIAYAHAQLEPGSATLDYAGLVADRPKVLNHLVSGIGLRNYRARGVPLVAQAVADGRLGIVIANRAPLVEALQGKVTPDGLLAQDVAALHGNFAHVGGQIWLPGKTIPRGDRPVRFEVTTPGPYTPGGSVTVDGRDLRRGETIQLAPGRHEAAGERSDDVILWRGAEIPPPPPAAAIGPMFTRF